MPGALSASDILRRSAPGNRLEPVPISRVLLIGLAVLGGAVALYFGGQALFESGGTTPGGGTGEQLTVTSP
jgi:hypothetical protein